MNRNPKDWMEFVENYFPLSVSPYGSDQIYIKKARLQNIHPVDALKRKIHEKSQRLYDSKMKPLYNEMYKYSRFWGENNQGDPILFEMSDRGLSHSFIDESDIKTQIKIAPFEDLGLFAVDHLNEEEKQLLNERLNNKTKPVERRDDLIQEYLRLNDVNLKYQRYIAYCEILIDHYARELLKSYHEKYKRKIFHLKINGRTYIYEWYDYTFKRFANPDEIHVHLNATPLKNEEPLT